MLDFSARLPERDFDVSLRVCPGDTLALLGPNGAGKSTLLSLIAGLLTPSDQPQPSQIRLAGRELVGLPPHDRRTSLLAQDPLLFPHLSVRDNIAFGLRARGAGRAAAHAKADQWLRRLQLSELAHRRPAQISGGQASRVAVARALAVEPRLMLLDEPLAALDVEVKPGVRSLLAHELVDVTTILVTHDVLDAVLLADRVAVLENGRLVEHGPTTEVLSRPRSAFAAKIAGLNLLRGTWSGDGVRLTGGATVHGRAEQPPAAGEQAVAVCRPAAVALYPWDAGQRPAAGSPRNLFAARVHSVEPQADLIRIHTTVHGDAVSADVTPGAAADLRLTSGDQVWLSVKAAEVAVYAAS